MFPKSSIATTAVGNLEQKDLCCVFLIKIRSTFSLISGFDFYTVGIRIGKVSF